MDTLKQDSDILSVLKMERMEPKTALVLCRQFDFKPGLIHLLRGQPDRSADLLAVFIEGGMHNEAIEICTEQPQLWQKEWGLSINRGWKYVTAVYQRYLSF